MSNIFGEFVFLKLIKRKVSVNFGQWLNVLNPAQVKSFIQGWTVTWYLFINIFSFIDTFCSSINMALNCHKWYQQLHSPESCHFAQSLFPMHILLMKQPFIWNQTFGAINNSQTWVKEHSMQIQRFEQLHWVSACVRFKRIKGFFNKR